MSDSEQTCDRDDLLQGLQALYTELAQHPDRDFGWGKGKANARALGYHDEWLAALPDCIWESAAAVGNPFSLGGISSGQTVVDLGCGAGADACLAARMVGPGGRVMGIDCTPAMIHKARENAAAAGLAQVEFQVADMAALPLGDAIADVVISNGAVNLARDKAAVLGEALRVLRPGGRLQMADMVRRGSDCGETGDGSESWANCVSGTLAPECLLQMLSEAGFSHVGLEAYTGYSTAQNTEGALIRALRPLP